MLPDFPHHDPPIPCAHENVVCGCEVAVLLGASQERVGFTAELEIVCTDCGEVFIYITDGLDTIIFYK